MEVRLKTLENGRALYLEINQRFALPYAHLGVSTPSVLLSSPPLYPQGTQNNSALATVHRTSGPSLEMGGQGNKKQMKLETGGHVPPSSAREG